MVLIEQSGPDTLPIGAPAPSFTLPATDGKTYSLEDFKDARAVVVAFTCNHCPYAQAVEGRYNDLAREYGEKGVVFVGINPNDADNYPEDSFENMKRRAEKNGLVFHYLRDESQEVARAYGAVCTPHYFLLGPDRTVVYEGRLDDNWQEPDKVTRRELRDAIEAVLNNQPVPAARTNPMGCSIKWKEA